MSTQRKVVLMVLSVSFAMGSILSYTPASAQVKEEIIKFGVVGALTGPAAAWGGAVYHGVELAIDDWNAAGGVVVKGVRYKFKCMPYDDKYTANTAMEVVNKLIYEDGVKYFAGPQGSAGGLAVAPVVTRNRIINTSIAYDDRTIDPANKYTFRMLIPSSFASPAFFKWIVENYKIKTSAHISPNDSSGYAQNEYENKVLRGLGVTILDEIFYERATTDFMPFVTKILAKNPDMITCGGSPTGSIALIAKQARAMGYKGVISNTSPTSAADLVPVIGKDAEGIISCAKAFEPPLSQKMIELLAREKTKYGRSYATFPDFYVFFTIVAEAIQRAQSLDTTDIKNILEDPTQVWTLDFIEKGKARIGSPRCLEFYGESGKHQAYYPFLITQVRDGKDKNVALVEP